jgi:hypothetical protein
MGEGLLTPLDVKHAYHALALDERRKAFRPTLWYIPKALENEKNKPELKQVWVSELTEPCYML